MSFTRQLLRIDEVAMYFGVTRRSVDRWLASRRLPHVRTPSGRRLIPRAAISGATANAA